MKREEAGEANYDPRMISAKKTPEKSRYPVHYLVWHNKHRQLEKELAANEQVRTHTSPHVDVGLGLYYMILYGRVAPQIQ